MCVHVYKEHELMLTVVMDLILLYGLKLHFRFLFGFFIKISVSFIRRFSSLCYSFFSLQFCWVHFFPNISLVIACTIRRDDCPLFINAICIGASMPTTCTSNDWFSILQFFFYTHIHLTSFYLCRTYKILKCGTFQRNEIVKKKCVIIEVWGSCVSVCIVYMCLLTTLKPPPQASLWSTCQ